MRAEEGDETVKDYAVEGKQTLGRIRESQRRAESPFDTLRRWLARFWPGKRDS